MQTWAQKRILLSISLLAGKITSLYYPILYVTFSRPSLQDGRDDGCNIHLSSRGCQNSTSVLQFRVRVLALGAV